MSFLLGYGFVSVLDGLLDDISLLLHTLQALSQLSILLLQLNILQSQISCEMRFITKIKER